VVEILYPVSVLILIPNSQVLDKVCPVIPAVKCRGNPLRMCAGQNFYLAPNVGFNQTLEPRACRGKAAQRTTAFNVVDDVEEEFIDKAQKSALSWAKHRDSRLLTRFPKAVTGMTRLAFL
jgi:hypothetical protein